MANGQVSDDECDGRGWLRRRRRAWVPAEDEDEVRLEGVSGQRPVGDGFGERCRAFLEAASCAQEQLERRLVMSLEKCINNHVDSFVVAERYHAAQHRVPAAGDGVHSVVVRAILRRAVWAARARCELPLVAQAVGDPTAATKLKGKIKSKKQQPALRGTEWSDNAPRREQRAAAAVDAPSTRGDPRRAPGTTAAAPRATMVITTSRRPARSTHASIIRAPRRVCLPHTRSTGGGGNGGVAIAASGARGSS